MLKEWTRSICSCNPCPPPKIPDTMDSMWHSLVWQASLVTEGPSLGKGFRLVSEAQGKRPIFLTAAADFRLLQMHRSDVLNIYCIRFQTLKEKLTFIIVLLHDGGGHYLLNHTNC